MSDPVYRLSGTVMSGALTAASEIHIALCHSQNVYAKRALLRALHNVLIVAEEGRQSIKQQLDEEDVARAREDEDHV